MRRYNIMNTLTSIRSISDVLNDLEKGLPADDVTMSHILDTFHERGFGFFLFLFALPAALPLPAVGYGTILGIPLVFLTAQQAIGQRTIWFPEKWKQKSVKRTRIEKMVQSALPWTRRIEKFVKPRLGFITEGVFTRIIGIFGFIMALSVCIPLP